MQQPFDKYLMFRNRLQKVFRHRSRLAARQGISCYRVYDHDLPEFPLLIEKYEGALYLAEYQRNHRLEPAAHMEWLKECQQIAAAVMDIPEEKVVSKVRKRKEDRQDQYRKLEALAEEAVVQEAGLQFLVNLTDYLDTGLFLDHRITRSLVRDAAAGKRVLNLFCYTGSFSVYAVAGGAAAVTSVDLSKTYLAWTGRNLALNFPDFPQHQAVQADVLSWLKTQPAASYDLIILDPPTFSNSKRMEGVLDIQRDHVALINECLALLSPGGILFFSTNFTRFRLETAALNSTAVKDITKATTPFDFEGKLQRWCYRISV